MSRPVITLLTDFGLRDHYAGSMKGVLLTRCPEASLVDISHEIPPFNVLNASYQLSQAWRCFPEKTVHLVVVDPGVGSARRPVVAQAGGHLFVAPDNGVLTMALESAPRQSLVVREIAETSLFRQPVSQTFHGRDVFAPVAAALACGTAPETLGPVLESPVRLDSSFPVEVPENTWRGIVLHVDRFGNVVTNFDAHRFRQIRTRPFLLRSGARKTSEFRTTYAAAAQGELFVLEGSAGYLELSLNQESAAHAAGVAPGDPLTIELL